MAPRRSRRCTTAWCSTHGVPSCHPTRSSRPQVTSEFAHPSGSRSLWFNPPMNDPDRRPQLTRERIVTEALAVIAQDGVQALTMRSLAARLGVVPGALYHHVGNNQQLQHLL